MTSQAPHLCFPLLVHYLITSSFPRGSDAAASEEHKASTYFMDDPCSTTGLSQVVRSLCGSGRFFSPPFDVPCSPTSFELEELREDGLIRCPERTHHQNFSRNVNAA